MQLAIYSFMVLQPKPSFSIALLSYVPAMLFLAGVFFIKWRETKKISYFHGIVAISIAIIASILQMAKVAIHSEYFTHNSVYHIIMLVSLFYMYICFKELDEFQKSEA